MQDVWRGFTSYRALAFRNWPCKPIGLVIHLNRVVLIWEDLAVLALESVYVAVELPESPLIEACLLEDPVVHLGENEMVSELEEWE